MIDLVSVGMVVKALISFACALVLFVVVELIQGDERDE